MPPSPWAACWCSASPTSSAAPTSAIFAGTASYYGFQFQIYLLIFAWCALPALAMGANFPLVTRLLRRRPGNARRVGRPGLLGQHRWARCCGAFLGEFVLLPRRRLRRA